MDGFSSFSECTAPYWGRVCVSGNANLCVYLLDTSKYQSGRGQTVLLLNRYDSSV